MAAFPPPSLRTQVPNTLREVYGWCRRGTLDTGFSTHPLSVSVALHQFEQLLNEIRRHRGPVQLGSGHAGHSWPTPHDCLAYFADWRREIPVAVSHVPGFFDSRWRTETVTLLAKGIDADRAFDRLPILADALEEAGCDHPLVLAHLREPYDHAHHCWVVDLLSFGGRPLEA